MKTKLSLEDAREAIKTVIRKNGCDASEITAEQIKNELKLKGSHSTTGPLIRSMLDEAILGEQVKYEKVSNRLKAAFMSELRRAADDASSALRKQLAESSRLNDELRDKYAAIHRELDELKSGSTTKEAAAAKKIGELQECLAEANGKISTFDEAKRGLSKQLEETKSDLAEKREEISVLKNDFNTVLENRNKLEWKLEDAMSKLKKAEIDYQTCTKEHDLTAGRVDLFEERISELKIENKRLVEQSDRLTDEIARLRENLLSSTQEMAAAKARLEELSKKSTAKASSPKKESAAGKRTVKARPGS